MPHVDHSRKDPRRVMALLYSLACNSATIVSQKTLVADTGLRLTRALRALEHYEKLPIDFAFSPVRAPARTARDRVSNEPLTFDAYCRQDSRRSRVLRRWKIMGCR